MHTIRAMTIADHGSLMTLLAGTPGLSLRDADSVEATARYLDRNPGFSFVAEVDGQVIACLMAGHDGRRGYLQHLVVLPAYRKRGIARGLIDSVLTALERIGILKSHLDVLVGNVAAASFWERQGWTLRQDIQRYSMVRGDSSNA